MKTYWYTYDAENRIKINQGVLQNQRIVLDQTYGNGESYELLYDTAGRNVGRVRVSESPYDHTLTTLVFRFVYDLRGNKIAELHPDIVDPTRSYVNGGIDKSFIYDATGTRLLETRSYYRLGQEMSLGFDGEGMPWGKLNVGGWLSGAEQYSYDADGRLTQQITRDRAQTTANQWRALSDQIAAGTAPNQSSDLAALKELSRLDNIDEYGASGYDAAGQLRAYRFIQSNVFVHHYTTSYVGWEGYQESVVSGRSETPNYQPSTNTLTYDGFGRLVKQQERTQLRSGSIDDRVRYYSNNGDGRVMSRREGTLNGSGQFQQPTGPDGSRANYLFVHAGGQQHAELREGGQVRYQYGELTATQLQSLNTGGYSSGGGKTLVQPGDTLSAIAQRVYGSSQLWYVLAQANGLSDPNQELAAGMQLSTPNVNVGSNDATTFKPYNPAEAIGSTTPNLPYIPPPPKEQCGAVGAVLAIVAMVVVAMVMPYILPAVQGVLGTGALATGVAFGASTAIGSAVSQGLGSAAGVSSFSWRQVAADGISAGISAGVGSYLQGFSSLSKLNAAGEVVANGLGRVVNGAVSYGASVVANTVVGRDANFSWKNVAASAFGSYAAGVITDRIPQIPGNGMPSDIANRMVDGFVAGSVQATTRRLMGEGRQNWGQIAVDAFGNALGGAWADKAGAAVRAHIAAREAINQRLYDAAWADGDPFGGPYDMTAAQRDRHNAMLEGAVAGPGGGTPSALTRARRDHAEAFDSGLKKLGLGKPTVLYSETISKLLERAEAGAGYTGLQLNGGGGRKTSLSVEEVKAIAAYVRAAGVEGAYTDVARDEMVMLVPVEATQRQVVSELRQHAGNLLIDSDISNLIGGMEFDAVTGRSSASASFDLMPLRRTLIARFDERLLANENVVEAAIAARNASAEHIDPTAVTLFSAPTDKEIALQHLDDVIRQERNNMIGAGLMPTKDGNSELLGTIYTELANIGIDLAAARFGGRLKVGSMAIGQLRDAAVDQAADIIKARVQKELDDSLRIGVGDPYITSADPTSLVQEWDRGGNEIFYRAMYPAHLRRLLLSGSNYEIVPSGETGISSLESYSSKYKGALVRFAVKPGTAEALYKIGLAADGSESKYPDLRSVHGVDWQQKYVQFKNEDGVPNILLGRGAGLELFRSNIVGYTVLRQDSDN